MRIQDTEAIAARLRKYALSPEDALAVAVPLAAAADAPVPILPADLASLMRPRRPPAAPDTEGAKRRAKMQAGMDEAFRDGPPAGKDFHVAHHLSDYAAVKSAVQYRARKAGLTWTCERRTDTLTVFTWTGYVPPAQKD